MGPEEIQGFATFLSHGGIAAIIAVLLCAIGVLVWERSRLLSRIEALTTQIIDSKKEEMESIKEIIDLYHQGNLTLVTTLAEIKGVLANIHPSRRS